MLKLILLAIRYNWDSQKANPVNLAAGAFGMVINNLMVLWGLWAMLFAGKAGDERMTLYFLSLNAIITISWGTICFFAGGLRWLGDFIEQGTLEPMMSTPRSPIFLAGISQSQTPALGDIAQGLVVIALLFCIGPWQMALRCAFFTVFSVIAFIGLFILAGSAAFFVERGSAVSNLIIETNLSLSFYPSGKVFTDRGRYILYVLPAAAAAVFPAGATESGSWKWLGLAAASSVTLFWVSVVIFNLGMRRYQSTNYVGARS